jgi:hypothetical protein
VVTLTLRSVTRSAAWRSVRDDMSSTSLCSAGSEGEGEGDGVSVEDGGGGDGDDVEVVASAVAVASARTRTRMHAKGLLRAETLFVASAMWKEKNVCGNGWDWYVKVFAYHWERVAARRARARGRRLCIGVCYLGLLVGVLRCPKAEVGRPLS